MIKKLAAASAIAIASIGSASAGVVYHFSFDNALGTLGGTIAGTITLDFLGSTVDSGIGQASDVRITSSPVGTPASTEGDNITHWLTQVLNRFEVLNGVIVDYEFGAAEGSPSTAGDNVFCLNNGSSFNFPPGNAYFCGANENFYGDASSFIYNTGGIQTVTFRQQVSNVPLPGTLPLALVAFLMLSVASATSRRKM